MRPLLLLLSVLCLLTIVSCVPASDHRGWTYADLRLLDPVDDTSTPSTDILAVYTRTSGSDFEIRIDLLDIPLAPNYNLLLYLDPSPWGTDPADWQVEISIPLAGPAKVFTNNPNLDAHKIVPRVVRDPWLDTVVVRLNSYFLPRDFKVHVFTIRYLPDRINTPDDMAVNISPGGFPPTQRAPLALVFWDVFPAATPAQALRRWDGAHTGPRGERHGLKHILDNAGRYGVPVVLLDLKTPASLAALDYLGITPQIQSLASRGLLILPDVAFGEPAEVSLNFSRRAAAGFGLPASQFVYNASSRFQSAYLAQFFPLDDISHLSLSGRTRLIPIPAADAIQATPDGLSLDVRRALVAAAFTSDLSDLVVLGGDLPHSTWGNENMAGPTFAWIAAHPWIQPLTGDDLMTFGIGTTQPSSFATPIDAWVLLADFEPESNNTLTDLAWQTYLTLDGPSDDGTLRSLRGHYIGQVGSLLAAASWAKDPSSYPSQDDDMNKYSGGEYSLSSQNLFAIIDNRENGAVLTNFFYLDAAGPHQIIAPSSQFTVGLSDPSDWHLELGEAADPSVIPGAFSDDTATWAVDQPTITTESITFTSPEGSVKIYRLMENGIEIIYRGSGSVNTRIPLAVDPQAFYFGPAEYTGSLSPGGWTWGQVNGIQVEVRSEAALSAYSFTDSLPYLSQSEDPDRNYPPGHYLPFPLSVINLQGSGNFKVQISVK